MAGTGGPGGGVARRQTCVEGGREEGGREEGWVGVQTPPYH